MIIVLYGSHLITDRDWINLALSEEIAPLLMSCADPIMRIADPASDCFGVYAAEWCMDMGFGREECALNGDYGDGAISCRNWDMMKGADLAVMLWRDYSPGTRNAIGCAVNQKLPCVVRIYPDGERLSAADAIRKAIIYGGKR